jgi:hypothetical protein
LNQDFFSTYYVAARKAYVQPKVSKLVADVSARAAADGHNCLFLPFDWYVEHCNRRRETAIQRFTK